MPVDLSKPHPDRRRVNRDAAAGVRQDGMYSREIEMKRNRGEISCAECRRLKIKCDKQIPCQSCQRRGCASLCPNGSLATGQGTRFVIAATEHLHRRISRMSERIRQLEDALALLQASTSKEPHPLLCEDAIVVDSEYPDDRLHESDEEGTAEVSRALGTLSVTDHGLSRFFGSTGGSDLLLLDNDDSTGSPSQKTESDSSKGSNLPPQLQRFSFAFPFTPVGPIKETIALIRTYLPPWEQAVTMAEAYLENAAWVFRSVTRHQLVNEMLPSIYGKRLAYPSDDFNGPHDLALLFSMFALGSVLDVSLSTQVAKSEGEHYNQLALTALGLQPVLEKPSLATIQTLHIASIYHAMLGSEASGGESSMEFTWSLVNLAAHLAQTIGLHRDPAQWETDPKMVQRRRMVFWDLFVGDSWHALSTGRPPAFNRDFIDCKFPQEDDLPTTLDPGDNSSLSVWMFRFSNEVVAEIIARTLTAMPPRYHTVKELDRKIRDFLVSPQTLEAIRGGPGVDPLSVPISTTMLTYMLGVIGDIMLLSLHRNFFIQALIENPDDPIRSQYAPSFLATVRAAKNIIQSVGEHIRVQPVIVSRFWTIWTYTFSAAVVFAFIASRGPRSPLANDAMTELDKGCSLIEEASKVNRRAAKALVILNRMREKARRAMVAAQDPNRLLQADSIKQEENDEFTVFAGRTKVFRPGATSSPPSVPPPAPDMMEPHTHAQVHTAHGQGPGQQPQSQSSMLGEWLARQEQYVGYDPHYVPPIEAHPQPHAPQHQHQHQQYGYATPEPQYTLDAVQPPLPQYMTTPYQYPPPPQGPLAQPQPQPQSQAPSPSSALGGPPSYHAPNGPPPHPHPHQHQHQHPQTHPQTHPQALSHHPHQPPPRQQRQEDLELRRTYAAAFAPSELSQLGLAANGSRVSETWMSFMHTGMLEGGDPGPGPGGRRM